MSPERRAMRASLKLAVLSVLVLASHFVRAADQPGVSNPGRARYHWIMHCQGCHGVDAQGTAGGAPRMAGIVGKFLSSEAGRAFLGRVPNVAFVALSDTDVAELLNWLLWRFDKDHIPAGFQPYDANEVNALRQQPLISQAFNERRKILQKLEQTGD